VDQHTHTDIEQAERVIRELRDSADTLIARSRELAEESERLKQRADDLTELIKRHLTGGPQPDLGARSATGGVG
jgi:chaperonin cofactor prefoldin